MLIAANRCGRSIDGASTARQTPEWASEPTSRNAFFVGNPQCVGASGSSSQSNWVSSPGGCSMTAFGRFVTCAQAAQAGRSPRSRICRVNVGYDPA